MIQVGDRVTYHPTPENSGVLGWAGVTGVVAAIEEEIGVWGYRIQFDVDKSSHYRVNVWYFWTFTSRVKKRKDEISWEV